MKEENESTNNPIKSKTFEEAFANSTDRLTLKRAAKLLKVSKSTMRRLVVDKKIFYFKLGNHYIVPTKALEEYTKSNGSASWLEQAENVGKYETRIIDICSLSLPIIKHDRATKQDKCVQCGINCWHSDNTENCKKEFPNDYKIYCYKCALVKESVED